MLTKPAMGRVQTQLSIAIAAGMLAGTILQGSAWANPRPIASQPQSTQGKRLTIKTGLSRQGLPGRRTGGGSRDCMGACGLVAIAPEKGHILTLAAKPRFLFYLPAMANAGPAMANAGPAMANAESGGRTVEFILRDSRNQIVYEADFSVSKTAGFFDLDLAQQQMKTTLRPNENYRWQFSLIANAKNRAHDIDVLGVVQRVLPQDWIPQKGQPGNLALLNQSPSLAQATLYQNLGLWQDSVSTLLTLMASQPQTRSVAIAQLQSLIAAQGPELIDMAQQPITLVAGLPLNIASGEALSEVR